MLSPGSLFTDRLVVLRRIGAGGLGEVYEVQHKFTRHHRAVKVLHARFRKEPDVVDRFLREASAAGRIGNPHIVETFDAGYLEDGSPFIVMEFLEGKPLSDVVKWNGRLDVGLASAIMTQVCTAVQAAHDANIIHRDLKPENLFLAERDGRAFMKVLDFGVSKFQGEEGENLSLTQSGITMGTPLYMSPEQLRNAKNVDSRSDVYSLGVILYELVSGDVPYKAESFAELAVQVLNGKHASLHEMDGAVPIEVSSVVTKAMHLDPVQRYQSPSALRAALEPFARNRSVSVLLQHEVLPTTPSAKAPRGQELASDPHLELPDRATPAPLRQGPRSSVLVPPQEPPGPGPRGIGGWLVLGLGVAVAGGSAAYWGLRDAGPWAEPAATVRPPEASSATPAMAAPKAVPTPVAPSPPVEATTPDASVVSAVATPAQPAASPPAGDVGQAPPSPVAPPPRPREVVKRQPAANPRRPAPSPGPSAAAPPSVVSASPSASPSQALKVEAPAPAPLPALGTVDIDCQPVPCTVLLDGKEVGETPLLNQKVLEGTHTGKFVNLETGDSRTRTFQVRGGERTKVIVPF